MMVPCVLLISFAIKCEPQTLGSMNQLGYPEGIAVKDIQMMAGEELRNYPGT